MSMPQMHRHKCHLHLQVLISLVVEFVGYYYLPFELVPIPGNSRKLHNPAAIQMAAEHLALDLQSFIASKNNGPEQ